VTGFQKQRPIASVATAIETKVAQPIKSAIKISVTESPIEDEPVKTNGHAGTKKRKAAAKNGDAKRKKASDFF
jgi:hypothetical protein